MRGFVIAKLYLKIGEYASAQHYVSGYLAANEAAPQAHRLLGDCLCKLKQPEKALSSYQRSFQLDNKQTDLLIDGERPFSFLANPLTAPLLTHTLSLPSTACNLILSENLDCAKANAKFWCEAAANSRIQHESVFNVKFKMLAGDENKDTKQVEEMIVKEINNRPSEVSPRLQLVNYYIAKNRLEDAFKFISDVMNRNPSQFLSSLDWYAAVHKALNQYRQATDVVLSKNWDFWVLCISAVDRQLSLVLAQAHNVSSQQSAHLMDCQSLLFEMDQMLYASGNISFPVRPELAAQMINHFQGQFLLHAASFLYKRERTLNNNQWWATINKTLPLLFTAFRLGIASTEDAWLKQANESVRELVRLWQRQGAFRCSQAGRTLLSCVQTNNEDGVLPTVAPFKTPEELTDAARKQSSSPHWTTSLFRHLFTNDDHFSKASTSFMVTSNLLADPTYELPTVLRLQMYERIAESLQSDSLPQLIYLYVHTDKLAECDFNVFPGLELTASNIFNCSAATLNKLDIESFLVAAVMQTQSRLEKDAKVSDGPRPKTLPFANMDRLMCSEEQLRWWQAAYNSTNGISTDETVNVREVLQDGIEAVRCVGSPKMDLMIALLTGDVLKQKTENNLAIDLTTKKAYEDRVENLFMCALHLYKNQSTATVANKRRLFQYSSNSNNPVGTEECETLLEGAIVFLAEQHFRNGDYEGCIDILTNIQLPYATYYIAEAYKKMDETNRNSRTPTRSGSYQNKVKQFLGQTQKLLASASKRSHSLRTVVSNELKKLQFSDNMNNSVLSVDEDSLNLSHIPNTMMNRSASNGSSLVRDQVSALTALVTQLTIQNTMLQTEMSDIKKMLQQKKEEPATPPNLSESMFQRLDEQQRMSSAYHPFPHYADYGRYSVGGFPPMGAPYQGMPPFQSPSQYPPHMRTPAAMYGHPHDVNAMALAQANAGLMPTFDPITGTVSVSPMPGGGGVPQQAQTKPPGYYQPPPAAAPQTTVNVAHQQSALASQLQQPPLASSSTVDQVFVGNNILKTWNSTYNNEPVEKTAPANVVITSSDPVPMHNTVTAQTLLSVTIPPQHIKNFGQAPKVNDHFPTVISGSFNNLSSTLSHTATNISGDETATEEDYYGEEYHVHEEEEEEEVAVPPPVQTVVEPLPKSDKISFGIAAQPETGKPSPFSSFSFGGSAASTTTASPEKPFSSLFGNLPKPPTNTTATPEKPFGSLFGNVAKPPQSLFGFSSTPTGTPKGTTSAADQGATATGGSPGGKANNDETEDDYVPTAQFKPVIELPKLVEVKTGEEDEDVAFEHRAKLLRFDPTTKEWKERGLGNIRIMVLKTDASQVRLLMRREQVLKLACNQRVTKDQVFNKMPNSETALSWYAQDFAENELKTELFAIRFKTSDICQAFHAAILAAQANMKADAPKPAAPPATTTTEKKGFGDMFKKQSGSWECNGCLIVNKSEALYCVACDSPKDDTVPKKESKAQGLDLSGVKPGQFSFGFGVKPTAPQAPVDVPQNLTTTSTTTVKKEEVKPPAQTMAVTTSAEPVKGFGDAFKPKAGSWECSACYITNKGDAPSCISCATPKDGSSAAVVPAASGLNFGAAAAVGGGGFNFGTAKSTISFGVPQVQGTAAPANSFANLFSSTNSSAASVGGLFGQSAAAPANGPSFGLDSKQTFDFVFKPKSPGKVKSPQKLTNGGGGGAEEEGGSDEEDIEEENTAYFTPVIPLPDKVEARTGEEEEEVLYSHRAKLYRYTDGEWKERGLGDVKILKHSGTGKLRVVMRREQVLKICLNHVLDENVEYHVKDNKSWHFVANDFSEGVLELLQFSLRFKSPDVATEFKEAVDNALSAVGQGAEATDDTLPVLEVTAGEGETNAEEIQLIKDLKLPPAFFDYNAAEKCAGCRGCEDDGFVFATTTTTLNEKEAEELPLQMPKLPAPVTKAEDKAKSIFGSFNQSLAASPNTSNNLFGSANMFSGSPTKPTVAFGGGSTFGQPTGATGLFSGMNNSFGTPPASTGGSLFGSSAFGSVTAPTSTGSIFGTAKTIAGDPATQPPAAPTSIFGQKSAFGSSAVSTSTFGSFNFGTAAQSLSFDKLKDSGNVVEAVEKPVAAESGVTTDPATVFKMDSNFSFASLAQQEPGSVFDAKPEVAPGGFFGLSNTNDFKHFNTPAGQSNGNGEGEEEGGEDATYDPHFEPIIALPEEISVSTGEEEETKLFGERGRLYRYDGTNKEWKERGEWNLSAGRDDDFNVSILYISQVWESLKFCIIRARALTGS